MCPECYRFICEEGCPNRVGRTSRRSRPHLFCTRCREPIEGGVKFYTVGTRAFCAECLEEADMDEIQAFFKIQSREALLYALGAASRIAVSEGDRL